jgi:glycosyltransferase involved in cell wall biosynthesis
MPLISVVIPAYNREATVKHSIASVLSQSIEDLEVIVVDDGSNDNTSGLVRKIAQLDPRVRLITHASNQGAQAARNSGMRAALGDWIAFLDSDDTWLPHSLEVRMAAARSGTFHVIHSPGFMQRFGSGEQEVFEVPALRGNAYRQVLRGGSPLFPALLIRAEALQAIGGLDEAIVAYQEWETAIRLARLFEFGFVSEPTFVYDCRGTDTISKDLIRGAKGYEQIVTKHLYAIAANTGPRSVSQHYARLSYEYRKAGDDVAARRCKITSFAWWPSPLTLLRKLRAELRSGRREQRPMPPL